MAVKSWKQVEHLLSSTSAELSSPHCQFWLHLPGFLGFNCLKSALQKDTCLDSSWSLAFSPPHTHPPGRPRVTKLPPWCCKKALDSSCWQTPSCFLFFFLYCYWLDQRITVCPQTSVLQASFYLNESFCPVHLLTASLEYRLVMAKLAGRSKTI